TSMCSASRFKLNHCIHRNAAHRLRRRAQSHDCTLVEGEDGHRRRSCRSVRAQCGLCLGEPSCTPIRPAPQERPYNIGNKSCSGSSTNSPPMPSALKSTRTLQQVLFSFCISIRPQQRAIACTTTQQSTLYSLYSRDVFLRCGRCHRLLDYNTDDKLVLFAKRKSLP